MTSLPKASLADYLPLPDDVNQYPIEFIEARGAIKLAENAERVAVGLTDKEDSGTRATIRRFHRQRTDFFRVDSVELSSYLGKRFGEDTRSSGSPEAEQDDRVSLDKLANDAPIINLVNSICIDAIRAGASDIHIEAGSSAARVRYRIDGALRNVQTIESARFPAVSSRIKIMANLNILERRQPQDGRITVNVGKENVDLRVSVVPVTGGESIVLRILGNASTPLSLDDLNFTQDQIIRIRSLLRIPHGLVLVTGPTGSGKTTTLNAMIRELVSETVKIVTIEDPVEFVVDGANQIQINEQIGMGFDVILRRVLRHDPNIIMIGEIRDSATAEIAVRAALTGHLVLSTLHTNDAVSVIPRLVNMGIEPYLVASVLRGAIAQRLVRRLCPKCTTKRELDAGEKKLFATYGVRAKKVADATGCQECGNSGFKGRTLISETFVTDPGLEELILENARSSELQAYLVDSGMTTITAGALEKIASLQTTLREASREVALMEMPTDA